MAGPMSIVNVVPLGVTQDLSVITGTVITGIIKTIAQNPDQLSIDELTQHSLTPAAMTSGLRGKASSSFSLSYQPASNTYRLDATVHGSGEGVYIPDKSAAAADSFANAAVLTLPGQAGEVSVNISGAPATVNFSVLDYFDTYRVPMYGRIDLAIVRTDVSPTILEAYWGIDPALSASAANPNLGNTGSITLAVVSYAIALAVDTGTNSQNPSTRPPTPQLVPYKDQGNVSASFQFVST